MFRTASRSQRPAYRPRVRLTLESLEHRLNPATFAPEIMLGPRQVEAIPIIQLSDETPIFLAPPTQPAPSLPASALPVSAAPAVLDAMQSRSSTFAPFTIDFISAVNRVTPQYVAVSSSLNEGSGTNASAIYVATTAGDEGEEHIARGSALFGVGGSVDETTVTTRRPDLLDETPEPEVREQEAEVRGQEPGDRSEEFVIER